MATRRVDLAPDADIRALVAANRGVDLVIVVAPGRDSVDQAMVAAAIGPLAVVAAPGARINAVVPAPGAASDMVAAAVAYLAAAHAVTGQLLAIGT